MTRTNRLDADALRNLLRQAATNDEAGQQALTRLYNHYDPLIRAALPKQLQPEDAKDLVQDVWALVVEALRNGRRLRRHEDVIALIAATLQEAAPRRESRAPLAARPGRSLWQRILGFIRLLLPAQEP